VKVEAEESTLAVTVTYVLRSDGSRRTETFEGPA
jgi:hypothetical protein